MSDFRIEPVVVRGELQPNGFARLAKHLHEISRGPDRFGDNYRLERMDIPGHREFDLLLDAQGELVTFCGLYSGGRYPQGVLRCLNRVYVAPRWRNSIFQAYATRFLLPEQLERSGAEARLVFVSREAPPARRFLKYWARKFGGPQWKVSERLIHVSPKGEDTRSFQFCAYWAREPGFKWSVASVSEEQWYAAKRVGSDIRACAEPLVLGV